MVLDVVHLLVKCTYLPMYMFKKYEWIIVRNMHGRLEEMYFSKPKSLWKIEIYTYFTGLDVFEEIKDFCKDICKNFSCWFFINWPPHGHIWNQTFKISPKVHPFHVIFCFLIHLPSITYASNVLYLLIFSKFFSMSSNDSWIGCNPKYWTIQLPNRKECMLSIISPLLWIEMGTILHTLQSA